ncbi:MAG: DegT/DnrJ/EryC1/StrS family aminotransferase, partial [Planctomycetota bacterium]
EIARKLIDGLKGVKGLQLPTEPAGRKHVYHLFQTVIDGDRDAFVGILHDKYSIRTAPLYPPVYRFTIYKEMGYKEGIAPVAERTFDHSTCLPMTPALTDKQITYMIDSVRRAVAESR